MDWMMILNMLLDKLIPVLVTVIAGIFTYLGTKVKTVIEAKAQREKEKVNNEIAKQVIGDVVRFVQQVYSDLNGADRLQKAIEQASAILQNKGITLTETEINMLIESAVYGLKEGLSSNQEEKALDKGESKG